MILGRPTNLWLGALTAIFNVFVLFLAQPEIDIHLSPELVLAVNVMLGALVVLVAGLPPVVGTSDTVVVKTNNGHTDKRISFNAAGEASTQAIEGTEHPKGPVGGPEQEP